MNQNLESKKNPKHTQTIGAEIRKFADRISQETALQVKATSRILGAAAQISENHDRLIDEVVDMVESDLEQEAYIAEGQTHTAESLKQRFENFEVVKIQLGLKAVSWAALAQKLNNSSTQYQPAGSQNLLLRRIEVIEQDISIIRAEVSQILALLKAPTR